MDTGDPVRERHRPGALRGWQAERMVTEIADFSVDPARGEQFVDAYRGARHLLRDAGAPSVRMSRGVECPGRFVMLVEWVSIEQHQTFRAGSTYADWRAAVSPFFAGDPHVEHVTAVD